MTNLKKHKVCIAACLVLSDGSRTVLGLRKNENKYGLIGGHVEVGETVHQALIREAKEESGIELDQKDLQIAHVLHYKGRISDYIFFFMQAKSWQGTITNREPNKCAGWEWFDHKDLPSNMTHWTAKGLENIRKGIFFSEDGWE